MSCAWSKVKLKKSHDFQNIIKRGKKIGNESFIIFSRRKKNNLSENCKCCKIGISVPQKILKKSHQRNKCKRQLRNIISDLAKENNFIKKLENWELVVVLRKGYLELNFKTSKAKFLDLILFLFKLNKKNYLIKASNS